MNKLKRYSLIGLAGGGWMAAVAVASGFNFHLDPETIQTLAGEAASNKIIQQGFFFTVAAWLHSGRVKKEITANFTSLTAAINNVADSLRTDLKKQNDELVSLNGRVKVVENNLKTGSK